MHRGLQHLSRPSRTLIGEVAELPAHGRPEAAAGLRVMYEKQVASEETEKIADWRLIELPKNLGLW
jgi:hypothetical protein